MINDIAKDDNHLNGIENETRTNISRCRLQLKYKYLIHILMFIPTEFAWKCGKLLSHTVPLSAQFICHWN